MSMKGTILHSSFPHCLSSWGFICDRFDKWTRLTSQLDFLSSEANSSGWYHHLVRLPRGLSDQCEFSACNEESMDGVKPDRTQGGHAGLPHISHHSQSTAYLLWPLWACCTLTGRIWKWQHMFNHNWVYITEYFHSLLDSVDFCLIFQIAVTTLPLFPSSYLSWFYDQINGWSERGLGMLSN